MRRHENKILCHANCGMKSTNQRSSQYKVTQRIYLWQRHSDFLDEPGNLAEVRLKSKRRNAAMVRCSRKDEVRTDIDDAVSVPRGFLEMQVSGQVPDLDQEVIVYVGGVGVVLAGRVMREMGYQNVYSMRADRRKMGHRSCATVR